MRSKNDATQHTLPQEFDGKWENRSILIENELGSPMPSSYTAAIIGYSMK